MTIVLRSLLAVVVAAATLAVTGGSADAMGACGRGSDQDQGGGLAWVYCRTDGHPGGIPTNPRDRWDPRCIYWIDQGSSNHDYEDGYTVTTTTIRTLDLQESLDRGLNPTGTYAIVRFFCYEGTPGDPTIATGIGGDFLVTLAPPVSVEDLRDDALARIDPTPPPIASNPSYADGMAVVQTHTWFWVEETYWERIESEAEQGFVEVLVTARPHSMTWRFANGDIAECFDDPDIGRSDAPGIPWTPGASEEAPPPDACTHVFEQSSDTASGDTFAAEATATWIFSWRVNGVDLGDFGTPFEVTTPFTIDVGEIQAIES